jgi:hypothetical protein
LVLRIAFIHNDQLRISSSKDIQSLAQRANKLLFIGTTMQWDWELRRRRVGVIGVIVQRRNFVPIFWQEHLGRDHFHHAQLAYAA